MPADHDALLALELETPLRVAGEKIEGAVLLDFKALQTNPLEDVQVNFRGTVLTKITRQEGDYPATRRTEVELVHENVLLWQKGSAYPLGSDVLRLPFCFVLPSELLPSSEFKTLYKYGVVAYSVEVVGNRSGLRPRKRIMRPIPVVPHDVEGARLRDILRVGWTGDIRTWSVRKDIRKGIWGDFSHVDLALEVPALKAYPLFVDIPFTLIIVTTSKPMRREDVPTGEPIFPTPPHSPRDVEVSLVQKIELRAGPRHGTVTGSVTDLGGFGEACPGGHEQAQVDILENSWIPGDDAEKLDDTKRMGVWKQQVAFKSTFSLNCSPSFTSKTMSVSYCIDSKVKFAGLGNDVKISMPIEVISSMPPPGSDGVWDGPPPELDLPPSYLSASDCDHDDKNEGGQV